MKPPSFGLNALLMLKLEILVHCFVSVRAIERSMIEFVTKRPKRLRRYGDRIHNIAATYFLWQHSFFDPLSADYGER